MPYSSNLYESLLVIYSIYDSVISNNYFTYSWEIILWDDSAKLGKVLQIVTLGDESVAEGFCALSAVAAMKVTMSRRSSRETGDQINL